MPNRHAFTLIELSIVLVIIGLIVGGVLVGRDLIRAAELRQLVAELNHFNVAATTFRSKYNCLPGDCAKASGFGFSNPMGDNPNGDGNGLVCDRPDGVFATYNIRECKYFWTQLIDSNLIPRPKNSGNEYSLMTIYANSQNYSVQSDGVNSSAGITSNSNIVNIGSGPNRLAGWLIAAPNLYSGLSLNGKHIFTLGGGYNTSNNPLLIQDAYTFDAKIDDGLPDTGNIVVIGAFQSYGPPATLNAPTATATAGNAGCRLTSTTPATYNITYAAAPDCKLAIGAHF